jgi:transposase
MPQVSVIMGPERRRRWRPEEKLAVLAEAFAPGASVTEVARRRDVATSLIYQWRKEAMGSGVFVPAVIAEEVEAPREPPASAAVIVVELGEVRVSIGASAPANLVTAALKALK